MILVVVTITVIIIAFLLLSSYFNDQSALKEEQEIKEKQEIEQKIIIEQWIELERKKQIEDTQKPKVLRENQTGEIEQKNKQQFQNKFIIYSNEYLKKDTTAFFHSDYHSGGNWEIDGMIENMIWTLKNDVSRFPSLLPSAKQRLENIISTDLPQILNSTNFPSLTVCVVPRSKAENYYRADQLLFRRVISDVVDQFPNFENGTNYIVRHTNTRTTHLDKRKKGGDGNLPYPGITKDTCTISDQVNGKDILLIDDLYTKSVNINEDAIQALLNKGANSVIFYSVGKTVSRN